MKKVLALAGVVTVLAVAVGVGQGRAPSGERALKSYRIAAKDLPPPSTSGPNPPKVVPRPADAQLTLPPGFQIETFAEGFKRPRWAVEAPNGDVFVSDPVLGGVVVLRDANGDRLVDQSERTEFATGLKQPFGMAFSGGSFYVAATDAVLRFDYAEGQRTASGPPAKVTDLPTGPSGHWTRDLRFSPDGSMFYVSVGSSSNIDLEPDPLRAAVLRFKVDGSGREVVVSGTRNPVGLSFHPRTGDLWVAVQERDGMGEELVPDYVARVRPGAFFGWPYAYIGPNEEPKHKGLRPDLVKATVVPEVLLQAHSSVLGFAFYDRTAFPTKYRNGAFAAFRGSSNRSKRTGYKVVFLPFTNGQADGGYEDFVTGWMLGEDRPEVWGRPVGLAVLKDGSMLVTDDGAGKIWRITYRP